MTGIKPLPSWMHQHLILMDEQYGAVKTFREKAKLDHNTFKRLVEKGYGKPDVVLRVMYAIEGGSTVKEITAQMIKTVVGQRREEIMNLIRGNVASKDRESIYGHLSMYIMYDRGMKRSDIAAAMGCKSVSNVNLAVESVKREMDINRPFMKLVFEIEAELEEMGRG